MSIIQHETPFIPAPRAAVEHPSWCEPRHCVTSPDTASELLVVHRAVVLDEQRPQDGRLVVDVVRGDIVCAHGGELLASDPAAVRVHGIDRGSELTPGQGGRLAAAVARAAEIAGGAR